MSLRPALFTRQIQDSPGYMEKPCLKSQGKQEHILYQSMRELLTLCQDIPSEGSIKCPMSSGHMTYHLYPHMTVEWDKM